MVKPLWETIDKNMSRPEGEKEKELHEEVSLLLSGVKRKDRKISNPIVRDKKPFKRFLSYCCYIDPGIQCNIRISESTRPSVSAAYLHGKGFQ